MDITPTRGPEGDLVPENRNMECCLCRAGESKLCCGCIDGKKLARSAPKWLRCPVACDMIFESVRSRILLLALVFQGVMIFVNEPLNLQTCRAATVIFDPVRNPDPPCGTGLAKAWFVRMFTHCSTDPDKIIYNNVEDVGFWYFILFTTIYIGQIFAMFLGNSKFHSRYWLVVGLLCAAVPLWVDITDVSYCTSAGIGYGEVPHCITYDHNEVFSIPESRGGNESATAAYGCPAECLKDPGIVFCYSAPNCQNTAQGGMMLNQGQAVDCAKAQPFWYLGLC